MFRIFLLLTTLLPPLHAALIYDNSASDSGDTIFFSTGPYTGIGDQVTMGGTDRRSTTASVQFYNAGSAGTFDATLRFYGIGVPIGAPLFVDFLVAGINAPELDIFTVSFDTGSVIVPEEFVFLVSVSNVASGLDLGLNLYRAPVTTGDSSTSFVIVKTSSFSQLAAGTDSNLFFQLQAEDVPSLTGSAPQAEVPEPSSVLLSALGIVSLAGIRRRM